MADLRGRERSRYVTEMFARIAERYDLLNTAMTAGRHYAWRRMASDLAMGQSTGPALDVATGTGDFAFELAARSWVTHVVGLDYTLAMLSVASRKSRQKGLDGRVFMVLGDAHALPFPDDYFVCATVGFGVRNFIDVRKTMSEMIRVVRPGGRVVTLEIVQTGDEGPLARLFALCFRTIAPWLGAALAGDRDAYTYLPESVRGFLSAHGLAAIMEEAGLRTIASRRLALGTVAINVGEKPYSGGR